MKTIAVIFGGRSTEHDVSVITAISSIIKPLELTKQYKVEAVYIAKNGAWYWDEKLKNIDTYTKHDVKNFLQRSQPVSINFDGGLTLVKSKGLSGRKIQTKVDIVFPAMHGTYGEDGSLMGLLRMANVPFIGCDMDASVMAMDKVLAKQAVEVKNLPVAKYQYFHRKQFNTNSSDIIMNIESSLSYPMFVKPAHLGSSIGISRVSNSQELQNAIEIACHYDNKILVEEEISDLIEVTLPIIGNDELKVALLERPLAKSEDFFDFETKYMQGAKGGKKNGDAKGAQGYSELPAQISHELYEKSVAVGTAAYRIIGCTGIARVDMLINKTTGDVYFNEVNPLPGGLYQHNWRASGMSNINLVQELIKLAEEKWQSVQEQNTVFETNYLKQF